MARRVLFVEQTSAIRDASSELFVDAFVEVDWKIRMARDDWIGDVAAAAPTYKVRPIEAHPRDFNEYGNLYDSEDVAWLSEAMTKTTGDHSYKAVPIIARVNELGVKSADGRKDFKIEVMTGADAVSFVAAGKRQQVASFAKNHWWKIGLGLAVAYWWLT